MSPCFVDVLTTMLRDPPSVVTPAAARWGAREAPRAAACYLGASPDRETSASSRVRFACARCVDRVGAASQPGRSTSTPRAFGLASYVVIRNRWERSMSNIAAACGTVTRRHQILTRTVSPIATSLTGASLTRSGTVSRSTTPTANPASMSESSRPRHHRRLDLHDREPGDEFRSRHAPATCHFVDTLTIIMHLEHIHMSSDNID
jgi:hypothetical protein